ncbi:MAG TPA: hypothetical protein VLM75_02760 [Spirochaetota bacterium]|nr:hypothetical protein [Spirochaetota bacterium]
MKNIIESFCIDDRCDYYRRTETIFNELDKPTRENVDEHFLAKHIML